MNSEFVFDRVEKSEKRETRCAILHSILGVKHECWFWFWFWFHIDVDEPEIEYLFRSVTCSSHRFVFSDIAFSRSLTQRSVDGVVVVVVVMNWFSCLFEDIVIYKGRVMLGHFSRRM